MSDQREKPDHYKYYLLGHVTPVRISFDQEGRIMGAEVPDAASSSGFLYDHTYLSRLRESDDVEAIDKEAFDRQVRAYIEARRTLGPSL